MLCPPDEDPNVPAPRQVLLRLQLQVHLRSGRRLLQLPAVWTPYAYVLCFSRECYSHLCPETGLNPYDVRMKCDRSKDGDLCYKQMQWIETWMNNAENKVALGVNPDKTFQSCNMEVNQAFFLQGDGMHNSALLLPDLVEDGIRLLVYAGNAGRSRCCLCYVARLDLSHF
jgi:cathepsin A (carboxypeptidase C)